MFSCIFTAQVQTFQKKNKKIRREFLRKRLFQQSGLVSFYSDILLNAKYVAMTEVLSDTLVRIYHCYNRVDFDHVLFISNSTQK